MRGAWAVAALVLGLSACSAVASSSVPEGALRYVALGDSYTIGTSVSSSESWPSQLVARVPAEAYRANVAEILDAVLVLLAADRILCVATPDFTVTPQGAAFGSPDQQRSAIERVNVLLSEACAARHIRLVPDIFTISQAVATDTSLVADDGLHPSGVQYALWVDAIQAVVEELLLPSNDR